MAVMQRRRLLVLASTYPARAGDGTPAFVRDLAAAESSRYETTVLVPAVPGSVGDEVDGALDVRRFRFFPRRWEDLADGAILENLRSRKSRWLQVPAFLLAEANLGLLGLGIPEPVPSWGGLLRDLENLPAVTSHPEMLAPAALLFLTVTCFHLLVPSDEYHV